MDPQAKEAVNVSDAFTPDEVRYLAGLLSSPAGKALEKAFRVIRERDRSALLSEQTDFPMTQYHRGRLSMLADLALLLGTHAPERYQKAQQARKSSPAE